MRGATVQKSIYGSTLAFCAAAIVAFVWDFRSSLPLLFLLLAQIPMIGFRRHLARRARRPQGAKSLRYDDHLGEGALPDFVRETFQRHHNLIAANLPGTPDRFTLTIVDNPPRKRILSRENPSEFPGLHR